MKLEFSQQIFEKSSNIKFHENPSSGSRVVPCGRTDRQADFTKIIIVIRNFANALKNLAFFFKIGFRWLWNLYKTRKYIPWTKYLHLFLILY